MFSKTAIVALFAGIAAAVHAPVGEPSGNPISKPGLNEIVPAGQAYTITWEPTTPNPISILLLRGPSENVVPLGAPLVEGKANDGTFSWVPSSDLEADVTHYGLQIIDDVTGQYQWSTQFGISNDEYTPGSSSSIGYPTESSTEGGYPTGYPTESSYPTETGYPTVSANVTEGYPTKTQTPDTTVVYSTGYPVSKNSSVIYPTKSMSVPASLKTTASETGSEPTTTGPAQATGAAAPLRAGLGLAGAVAGLVFML